MGAEMREGGREERREEERGVHGMERENGQRRRAGGRGKWEEREGRTGKKDQQDDREVEYRRGLGTIDPHLRTTHA